MITIKKLPSILFAVLSCIFSVFALLLLFLCISKEALAFSSVVPESAEIREVTLTIGNESKPATLPLTLKKLPAGQEIKITFPITPKDNDLLYVTTYGTPVTVTLADETIFSYQFDDRYARYKKDPADVVQLLPIGKWHETVEANMYLVFPKEESSITINAPLQTDAASFIRELFVRRSIDFLLGAFLLMLGFLIICSSLIASHFTESKASFLWLGSFALISGIWDISNSEIAHLILQKPIFLYLLHRISSFMILIPLGLFTIQAVKVKKPSHLKIISVCLMLFAAVSTLLQLLGLVSFTRSTIAFIILVAVSITVYIGVILYELIVYRNRKTFYFLFPMTILIISALARILHHFIYPDYFRSDLFQICILIFFLSLCASGISQIVNQVRQQHENKLYENELRLLNLRLSEQLRHQEDIMSASDELRRRRHDFRHYLAVLKDYNQNGKTKEIDQLIDEQLQVKSVLPDKIFCENAAINAVLSYYHAASEEQGISTELHVEFPTTPPGNLSENELCVIFGNLLENAIEACAYIDDASKRFIVLKANIHMSTYVISMENSFDGNLRMENNQFFSRKRDEIGIGLMSIKGIARNRKGEAYFTGEGNIFRSHIYLTFETESEKS